MQDKSTYLLASESEAEMEDWINLLNKILHSSFEIAMAEKRNGDIHDGVFVRRFIFLQCLKEHKYKMEYHFLLVKILSSSW